MGHARTYLTFDILRRVLSHYFGYNIFYVMNITDIDDKIIRRARQNHLYGEYVAKNHELSNIINDINDVLVYFAEEVRAKIDKNETKECKEMLLKGAKDLLSDWLDSKMGQTVNDNEVSYRVGMGMKLKSFGNNAALQEGEGDLSGDRRRPGWHIECSAMASELLGSSLDIHSGGCDLKFPHHDNELAQSEAFFDNDNWTKIFLHSGHLTIAGCKMSKSLKNFISIQDHWNNGYGPSNSSANSSVSSSYQRWGIDEIELNNKLIECQSKVHSSFCDNVDTKSALDALKTYVSAVNFYVEKKRTSDSKFNSQVLRKGAEYITGIFKVVGLIPECGEMGFSSSSLSGGGSSEEFVMPYLNSLAEFRDNVRKKARELKATDILKECDRLRDDVLPDLGVRLEDKESEPTVIKLVDKEELLREKEQKKKLEEFKAIEKQNKKAAEDAKKAAAEAQNKIPPSEMFRKDTNKYSKFDEKGIPTHDVEGEEISKAQLKKLNKLYQVQEKKYTSYLESKNTKGDARDL
ncbi:CARS [Lepeophtheirus salmonis]|uniref:Cysteine--tRNA ligase, cytoplasmic n=1 Tax=Lepeophtheirus salmonis TaxID=72036 RepID=A0A7R8CUZ7_LEPSM|nr:CARS [Lepeophtheirus salmonis]CAF2940898.1 CARS [Lepeophtheirus salmonis]